MQERTAAGAAGGDGVSRQCSGAACGKRAALPGSARICQALIALPSSLLERGTADGGPGWLTGKGENSAAGNTLSAFPPLVRPGAVAWASFL